MLYQSHLYNARDSNITWSAMAVPHKLHGDPNLHTSMPKHHYTGSLHITEANEPSAWNDRLQAHQLIYLLTCITSETYGSFTDRNSFPNHAH